MLPLTPQSFRATGEIRTHINLFTGEGHPHLATAAYTAKLAVISLLSFVYSYALLYPWVGYFSSSFNNFD